MKLLLTFLLTLSVPLALRAQPAAGPPLPLARVLALTAAHYPSIKGRQAELDAARYAVKERRDDYLPKTVFQAQALYSTSNQVQGTFYPNEGSAIPVVGSIKPNTNTSDMTWTSGSTLYTDWSFFNFGRVKAGVQVAQDELATRQAALDNEVFQQQVQAADAYLLVLVNEEIAQRQAANVRRAEVFRRVTAARASSGLRPGVDSSLADAEVARAKLLLTQAQQQAQTQRLRLAELTGLPAAGIDVDSAGFYHQLPTPAGTPNAGGVLDAHPLLRQALAEVRRSQDAVRLARLSWLPGIRLFAAGFSRGSGIDNAKAADGGLIYHKGLWDGVKFRAYDFMVGPITYWNLTDSFRAHNRAQQANFLSHSLQFDLEEQRLGLERENEVADLTIAYATENVAAADQQLAAARASYGQSLARYQAGLANAVELTQAVTILNRAEIDHAVAVAGTWQGLLKKAAATGDIAVFMSKVGG
ncbi:TolC family protein [Hymenobacter sp. UV11]|uniref:TolC family protein n=1 Tax=Hymenobacter sp. UV11 TaxID=1849735 RepID=UPI0010604943|nr:TolC family protein [Hymenobacter sp. UV11]TFZ66374.1 TolC family protein [Hymenobacter sp. UV11]